MSTPSTKYSLKCPSFRRPACWVRSVSGPACGKSHARSGTTIASVRGPANQPVDAKKMTAAQAATGAQRATIRPSADKLGDRLGHEGERRLVELGVDEALDLVALRRVALAAGPVGELRAREHVE